MNAVGIAEQESGRALGFFCGACGRSQLTTFCQNPVDVPALTELHRKAEACCTTSTCPKHDYQIYGWHLCPLCVAEGPTSSNGVAWTPRPKPISSPRDGQRPTGSNGVAWTPRLKHGRKAAK